MSKKKKEETYEPFITVENSSSRVLLDLDADTRANAINSLVSMIDALGFLRETLVKCNTTKGIRHNSLGIVRFSMESLSKALGADEDTEQEKALVHTKLRQANTEIHRLQDQLGMGVTVQAIGQKLYLLDQTIYNWWQNAGFTYCKSTIRPHSTGACFHVTFSVHIERHISSMESKPVTAKKRVDAKRKALGDELDVVYVDEDPAVLDNPNNRQWLINKLRSRFPKCNISRWESFAINRLKDFQIVNMEVQIDLTDVGDVFEVNEKYANESD